MRFLYFFIFITVFFISCVPDPIGDNTEGRILGELKVDLDLNDNFIRTQESPIGNLIADSILYSINNDTDLIERIKTKFQLSDFKVEFAFFNSGGLRFDETVHPDGIILAGDFKESLLDEIIKFDNAIYVTKVLGSKLKSILEHSVANVELFAGQFLQVSEGITMKIDKNQKAELLKLQDDGTYKILEEGERVVEVKINGVLLEDLRYYYIATSDYVASGGDDFIAFSLLEDDSKFDTEKKFKEATSNYILDKGIIEPQVEGRIVYMGK